MDAKAEDKPLKLTEENATVGESPKTPSMATELMKSSVERSFELPSGLFRDLKLKRRKLSSLIGNEQQSMFNGTMKLHAQTVVEEPPTLTREEEMERPRKLARYENSDMESNGSSGSNSGVDSPPMLLREDQALSPSTSDDIESVSLSPADSPPSMLESKPHLVETNFAIKAKINQPKPNPENFIAQRRFEEFTNQVRSEATRQICREKPSGRSLGFAYMGYPPQVMVPPHGQNMQYIPAHSLSMMSMGGGLPKSSVAPLVSIPVLNWSHSMVMNPGVLKTHMPQGPGTNSFKGLSHHAAGNGTMPASSVQTVSSGLHGRMIPGATNMTNNIPQMMSVGQGRMGGMPMALPQVASSVTHLTSVSPSAIPSNSTLCVLPNRMVDRHGMNLNNNSHSNNSVPITVPDCDKKALVPLPKSGLHTQDNEGPLTNGSKEWEFFRQLQNVQAMQLSQHSQDNSPLERREEDSDSEEPLICEICDDKATGLHYGIITCEGCKGFFKRTVQNKRVYTCVGSGDCEVTKTQRNRCQYCRFKKCIQKGMVLAAVREDRMPGGRNSGAVYNLYKVKYKKHRKKTATYKQKLQKTPSPTGLMPPMFGLPVPPPNPEALLKHSRIQQWLAQTQGLPQPPSPPERLEPDSPEILHPRMMAPPLPMMPASGGHMSENQHPRQLVQMGNRPAQMPPSPREPVSPLVITPIEPQPSEEEPPADSQYKQLVEQLLECEKSQDIARYRFEVDGEENVMKVLCKLGDDIVSQLVQWTRQLPFYTEIPLTTHTQILTSKWHEVLLLTTSLHQARQASSEGSLPDDLQEHLQLNMQRLYNYLTTTLQRTITVDELYTEVGEMMDKVTHVIHNLRKLKLTNEEYVCLKVILLLNQADNADPMVEQVQDRYTSTLQQFVEANFPEQSNRFGELLLQLPQIQSAAALLLKSKMIYVPFLLNNVHVFDKSVMHESDVSREEDLESHKYCVDDAGHRGESHDSSTPDIEVL